MRIIKTNTDLEKQGQKGAILLLLVVLFFCCMNQCSLKKNQNENTKQNQGTILPLHGT